MCLVDLLGGCKLNPFYAAATSFDRFLRNLVGNALQGQNDIPVIFFFAVVFYRLTRVRYQPRSRFWLLDAIGITDRKRPPGHVECSHVSAIISGHEWAIYIQSQGSFLGMGRGVISGCGGSFRPGVRSHPGLWKPNLSLFKIILFLLVPSMIVNFHSGQNELVTVGNCLKVKGSDLQWPQWPEITPNDWKWSPNDRKWPSGQYRSRTKRSITTALLHNRNESYK